MNVLRYWAEVKLQGSSCFALLQNNTYTIMFPCFLLPMILQVAHPACLRKCQTSWSVLGEHDQQSALLYTKRKRS